MNNFLSRFSRGRANKEKFSEIFSRARPDADAVADAAATVIHLNILSRKGSLREPTAVEFLVRLSITISRSRWNK